jgi:prepilin-type N-terminal cleavage/methylation domain-containing protein
MRNGSSKNTVRRGMTLVELLVVLAIVMMIAAATIPRLRPDIDRARIREAACSIQLYLSSARTLAISTGRSCGVMIEPLAGEPGCSMSLTQIETPLPYGGDTTGSLATIVAAGVPSGGVANCNITLSFSGTPAAPSVALHPHDAIQVGYQGYTLLLSTTAVIPAGTASTFSAYMDVSHGETPAWLSQNVTGPYKIWRWPTKSAASALQLPSPAVIDLTWSGNDPVLAADPPTWSVPSTPTPVIIMFAADGKVDWISTYSGTTPTWGQQVVTPIYLLVGRRDEVANPRTWNSPSSPPSSWQAALTAIPQPPKTTSDPMNNVYDLNSLWVSINPATGLIVVTENCALPSTGATLNAAGVLTPMPSNNLQDSRYFARQSDAMGGK